MTATVDLPTSASGKATIPLQPMLGRVAVALEGAEAFGGLWPGDFVSQVAVVCVANMVDPLHTVFAKFPKRLLPARR